MTVATAPARPKTYRTENFPVASRLLAAQYRAPVMAFYDFVRAADEVADDPDLPPTEKLALLDKLEDELTRPGDGGTRHGRLRDLLIERNLDIRHPREMLVAFRSDVTHKRCREWDDLVSYCRYSAVPVGRFVLDVFGESRSLWPASDALCTALQVINHLQDCGDDYKALHRVYIPLDLLNAHGAKVEQLALNRSVPSLRLCLDEMCDRVSELLAESSALCAQVENGRLGLEIAVIHRLAVRLTHVLRMNDPLCDNVRLSPVGSAGFAALGAVWGGAARMIAGGGMVTLEPATKTVRPPKPPDGGDGIARAASGSTFYSAMRVLPEGKRNAIFQVYGFCRAVADIADRQGDRTARLLELDAWRERINSIYDGHPPPECAGLAGTVSEFGLRWNDFMGVIDGMEMDVKQDICAPDAHTLDLYCDRVASAVGRLCVRIFGMDEPDGAALAHHLGRALQLTNILRDLDEDAGIGRLYLPRQALETAGIAARSPAEIIAHPTLDLACRQVADLALRRYADADQIMARCPRSVVRAPRLMSAAYHTLLDRMLARGWRAPREPVHLGRLRLAGVVLRSLVL